MNYKIRHYIDLITVLTQKEIKVRYKNSFLGYLWSIGHPLTFAIVYYIAFKVVMKIQTKDYVLFLISGLFPWQWFVNSVNAAPNLFLLNASIIKKVNFPRNSIPFTQVLQDMIHFFFAIPVVILFLFIYDKTPSISWIYGIPALLTVQLTMTYGVCLLISSINLFFRDLERLAVILVTLIFYFTPIIYPETMVPNQYRYLMKFNPLAPLIISWRKLFLDGSIELSSLVLSLVYSLLFLAAGHYVYRKLSWKFAEVL